MNEPIQLTIEEVRASLIEYINNICSTKNIDYYFLENIMKDIYNEILLKKNNQLESMKKEYEKSIKEEKENGNDKN